MRQVYGQTKSYQDRITENKRRNFKRRIIFFVVIVALFSSGGIYALFFSPWLEIKFITIRGNEMIDSKDVHEKAQTLVTAEGILNSQKNVFFLDIERLQSELLAAFPIFSSVALERNPPHEVVVTVTERAPIGIWCFDQGRDCSFFDSDGVVWGKALPSAGSLLLSVNDKNQRTIIPEQLLSTVRDIHKLLPQIGVNILKIETRYGLPEDITVKTQNGWDIFMTMDFPVSDQVENLKIILDSQGDSFNPGYIDLRIEGRGYYR